MSEIRLTRSARPLLAVGTQLAELLTALTAYCIVALYVTNRWNLQPIEWGREATLLNGVILGLLYGFRNRTAYERWWEGRRLWGQLVNDSRNLACKIAAFVEGSDRTLAANLIVGFADGLRLHLRGKQPKLQEIAGFANETDAPAHVPVYLAGRLFQLLHQWQREGRLAPNDAWMIDPHSRSLLDVCGACERIRNTPLPASYKGMLRGGLVLNLVLFPWIAIAHLGGWGIPLFLLTAFFLLGVELIDSAIEEPFGSDRDDLDLDRYCQTIADSVKQTLPSDSQSAKVDA